MLPETTLTKPVWVGGQNALALLVQDLEKQTRIAVDTEANSLHAYHERVCLIQFSTNETDYLVDPFSITNLSPLEKIFSNPHIEKVFHAVDYDVYGLNRDFGFTINNLFDTMIAARTLGYKTLGLGNLLKEKFGIELNKRFQKADWGQRPLPDDLIDYARLDTRYLLALRDSLELELRQKGRWSLAHEDFLRASQVNGHNGDPRERWQKVSGQQDLTRRQKTILHELCLARERIAEKLDRPLFKVISDHHLLALAQNAPQKQSELSELGLSERQVHRLARPMLEAIQRGKKAPLVRAAELDRSSEAVLNRLQRLKAWRKETAAKLEVESDVILSRTAMQAIADKNPRSEQDLAEIMSESPWRLAHYGPDLLKALRTPIARKAPQQEETT
ncbi:MAG: HRDC domain-containing protein [Anaerolineales bacterium]|jgi:ribonuclease D|nr:HRDC domain-containing protein [Anaerolineales bacterium]